MKTLATEIITEKLWI